MIYLDMMKKTVVFLLTCFMVAVAFAQPQRVVADKIIATVGDKIILKSDVENAILDMQRQNMDVPANAKCLILEQAMATKALVLQAEKDSLPVSDEEIDIQIENRIRRFIGAYGSKEELERIAGKSIYQIKEDFKTPIRDQTLGEAMRNKIVGDIRITPNEVRAYYDKIPKDSLFFYESELEISQVVCYPKASLEAEDYAIQQLKEYKQIIESGKKDFKAIAQLYTQDPGSKENGGRYEINRNSKELDPTWLNKAFTLKPGQISNPFKTKFGYHIIQLVSRSGDDAVVRHILLMPQITKFETEAVLKKLDTVRAKLMTNSIGFGEAVNKFSDDEGARFNAGAITNREDGSNYLTIDKLDPAIIKIIEGLKVGEFSLPIEYTSEQGKKGMRIIYLKSKTDPHRENLRDDYNRLQARALEEKKNDLLEAWFSKRIPTYFIKLDPEYASCEQMAKWVGVK